MFNPLTISTRYVSEKLTLIWLMDRLIEQGSTSRKIRPQSFRHLERIEEFWCNVIDVESYLKKKKTSSYKTNILILIKENFIFYFHSCWKTVQVQKFCSVYFLIFQKQTEFNFSVWILFSSISGYPDVIYLNPAVRLNSWFQLILLMGLINSVLACPLHP